MESTMKDMYGELPDEVINLLTVALVRNRASSLGADEASLMRGESALVYRSAKDVPSDFASKVEKAGGWIRFGDKISVCFASGKALVRFLCR